MKIRLVVTPTTGVVHSVGCGLIRNPANVVPWSHEDAVPGDRACLSCLWLGFPAREQVVA